MIKKIFTLTTLALITTKVVAFPVQFENIRFGGTGCPSEVTQVAYAPDRSSASIIFQNFISQVPNENNSPKASRTLSQVPCNVFLEVKVPEGQRLDNLEVKYDMRGNASLERGVQGYFRSFMMSANGLGAERSRGRNPEMMSEKIWTNYLNDQIEDFTVSSTNQVKINSDCRNGGSDRVYIQIQHHLFTQIMRGYEYSNTQGTITMDTSDISGGIKLSATTSACMNGRSGDIMTPSRSCQRIIVRGRMQEICR